MRIAKMHKRPILPFLIGPAEIPIGFGDLNHTEAHDWVGDEGHTGYRRLKEKISAVLESSSKGVQRLRALKVRNKELRLPAFVFSLSSHETQVNPNEGTNLLRLMEPNVSLVSAYDAWKDYDKDKKFHSNIKKMRDSDSILFLDSGKDFAMLASVLTPKRLELMKTLRQHGPLSVRALSKQLERDYKNVHVDVGALEEVGLIQRTDEGLLIAPWDVIDAHLRLVA